MTTTEQRTAAAQIRYTENKLKTNGYDPAQFDTKGLALAATLWDDEEQEPVALPLFWTLALEEDEFRA